MGFSQIIKKAWTITWRYRALWVLGLFAGITGASSGGSGSGGSGSSSSNSSNSLGNLNSQQWLPTLERLLPLIVVVVLGMMIVGFVWWILSIAARGGLVYAVNEIESGRPFTLGASWNVGFGRWWRLFGLSVLLSLPMLVLVLLFLLGIFAPLLPFLFAHTRPSAAVVAPICGVVAIGVPVMIVVGFVLGMMYVLGIRFVVLAGLGVMDSAREAWRMLRARLKDTILMYLINIGMNIAAGLVVGIPLAIVAAVIAVPGIVAGIAGHWGVAAGAVAIAALVIMAVSLLYTGIWGTFTSALWTIFYRRVTGMEVVAPPAPAGYPPAPGTGYPPAPGYPPAAPSYPPPPAPPVAPTQPAPPMAPPPADA